jgi:G:T-mismatch repair DNA endonuclease (very short patch repair protein)
LALLDELAFERVIRDSENSTKITVSTIEATALRALLKAGLPMPQREIGFYRGSERAVTVPDFAWPEARLAVYVDGIYWHGGQDLQQAMLAAAGADKEREQQLQDRIKHTVVRDAAKRRYLVSLGWTVCAIAEPEIEAGLMPEIAKEIKAAYHLRMEGATPLAS